MKEWSIATKGPWVTEPKTDTQYKVVEDDNSITVSFQGSVSRLDWLQNINFFVKPYRHMKKTFFVHRGFLKKWKAVREDIIIQARTAVVKGKRVEVYGYSQGAALAMLCHEAIYFHMGVQPKTIVFGCPRVFSWLNKKELSSRLDRVVRYQNGNDLVTKIPTFPYRHYGLAKNIGKKRNIFRVSIKDHLEYEEYLND